MPSDRSTPPSAVTGHAVPGGILDTLALQRTGALGPGEAARASLRRAQASQETLQAFVTLPTLAALDAALDTISGSSASSSDSSGGPLAGIPIGVKDLMATADMVTTYGSLAYMDHVPTADAWVVARLRSLGGIVAGKTVTTEFAWREPGPTRNPWNLAHTPGGSSSGSAAAVAAGIVPAALGTQTFGSIIRPAAYCGVVGMKPSYGAIARTGVHPLAGALDHVGVFARSVSDAGYLLRWLAGTDAADPHGVPLPHFDVDPVHGVRALAHPRLMLLETRIDERAGSTQHAALHRSVESLRAAGATVVRMSLPAAFDEVWIDAMTVLEGDAAMVHGALCDSRPALVSQHVHALVARGRSLAATTYLAAVGRQRLLRDAFSRFVDGFDAVLTFPATGEAPRGLADTGDASFCTPWTYLGIPALNLPVALGEHGLPLGLQLLAPYRQDLHLLRVARWCEDTLQFGDRCPLAQ